jgi:hypothetical protein
VKRYIVNLFIWFSQTINVVFLAGHPDQTVSARAYVNKHKPFWSSVYLFFNAIFFWQEDHCMQSHNADVRRAIYSINLIKGIHDNQH